MIIGSHIWRPTLGHCHIHIIVRSDRNSHCTFGNLEVKPLYYGNSVNLFRRKTTVIRTKKNPRIETKLNLISHVNMVNLTLEEARYKSESQIWNSTGIVNIHNDK